MLGAYIFTSMISSFWIDPFVIMLGSSFFWGRGFKFFFVSCGYQSHLPISSHFYLFQLCAGCLIFMLLSDRFCFIPLKSFGHTSLRTAGFLLIPTFCAGAWKSPGRKLG